MKKIDTVMFDMTGTLEEVTADLDGRKYAAKKILECLKQNSIDLNIEPEELVGMIKKNEIYYKKWCAETLRESTAADLWVKFYLRDFDVPYEKFSKIAEYVATLWEYSQYKRQCRDNAGKLLKKLHENGYKVGIISNTISHTMVIDSLKVYGIYDYFDYIGLSSIIGYKKPGRMIFEKAAEQMNIDNGKAMYVGDTISRDVVGPKNAGYPVCVQITSSITDKIDKMSSNMYDMDAEPDYKINNLIEISGILEKINGKQ